MQEKQISNEMIDQISNTLNTMEDLGWQRLFYSTENYRKLSWVRLEVTVCL